MLNMMLSRVNIKTINLQYICKYITYVFFVTAEISNQSIYNLFDI